jgi:hypothetical protein
MHRREFDIEIIVVSGAGVAADVRDTEGADPGFAFEGTDYVFLRVVIPQFHLHVLDLLACRNIAEVEQFFKGLEFDVIGVMKIDTNLHCGVERLFFAITILHYLKAIGFSL